MLGAGGLALIASTWRAVLVWSPTAYDDITVTFVRINLLGFVSLTPPPQILAGGKPLFKDGVALTSKIRIAEVGIGIICACVPTFNILFTRYTKEHWGSNARHAATGGRSPALKTNRIRRLTGDGRGIHVWRKGHRYNKSLGSEVDVDVVALKNVESEREDGESETCPAKRTVEWCKKKSKGRRGEGDDMERKVKGDDGLEKDVERGDEMGDVMTVEAELEIEHVRDMNARRNIEREEDSGWPLSGGGNVVPYAEGERPV